MAERFGQYRSRESRNPDSAEPEDSPGFGEADDDFRPLDRSREPQTPLASNPRPTIDHINGHEVSE